MSGQFQVSPHLVKLGINIGILIILGLVIVQAFAGIGQKIAAQFPVTNDNGTIFNVYSSIGSALNTGAGFIGPIILVGLASVVLLVLIYLSRTTT